MIYISDYYQLRIHQLGTGGCTQKVLAYIYEVLCVTFVDRNIYASEYIGVLTFEQSLIWTVTACGCWCYNNAFNAVH